MRSLGAQGIPVYGLAHRRLSAANVSRFCAGTVRAGEDGRPTGDAEGDLEALLAAGRTLGKGTILMVGSDK